jgi:hypothetical protein
MERAEKLGMPSKPRACEPTAQAWPNSGPRPAAGPRLRPSYGAGGSGRASTAAPASRKCLIRGGSGRP